MSNPWIASLPADKVAAIIEKDGERIKERYHVEDVYFALWLHLLNRTVGRYTGLSFDDLEDWDYASSYEAGESPKDAAYQMLADNGYAA